MKFILNPFFGTIKKKKNIQIILEVQLFGKMFLQLLL
jgi:hypothetical protein